jgi:hypothetical protein
MSFSMRVKVPTKAYDHSDGNAQEQFNGGCWVGTMNDGTQAWLCGPTLRQIIDAYEAGRLTFNTDGSIKSYTPLP